MKTKTIIAVVAITLTMGLAAQAGAWMGGSEKHDCNNHMRGNGAVTLTQDQQKQVNKIKGQYRDELQTKRKAIQNKVAAISKAYSDDSTTISQLRTQRQELYNLKQDYRQTRKAVRNKIADTIGTDYYGANGCDHHSCDHNDDSGMMGDCGTMGRHGGGCR